MAHISFDASRLDKFVQSNELAEMQAMVNAADSQLREGTGAGNDFRGFLDLPVTYDKDEFARIKERLSLLDRRSRFLIQRYLKIRNNNWTFNCFPCFERQVDQEIW